MMFVFPRWDMLVPWRVFHETKVKNKEKHGVYWNIMNDSNQACITMNYQSQAGHADICSLLVRAGGASLQVWGERFGAEMIRLPYGNWA